MAATPVLPAQVSSDALSRKRFTRDDVDRLTEAGVFEGQRYELIDGDLIDKMGRNPPHASAIRRVSKWLRSFLADDQVQVQLPIEAACEDRERSLPEPDLAVLAELKPDHERRHPSGHEVVLVVEVAESSAAFDLSRKAILYAKAGVREYWVLDLTRRMLVVHRQTDGEQYRHIHLYAEGDTVSVENCTESVRVKDLLPEETA